MVTVQLEFSTQLSQQNSEKTFFAFAQHFPLWGLASRHLVSSRFAWPGLPNNITNWGRSFLHFPQRKIHRLTCLLLQPILSFNGGLLTSTSTWWALYRTVLVATTFSQLLIAHPNG
jgi:hypothetical protein